MPLPRLLHRPLPPRTPNHIRHALIIPQTPTTRHRAIRLRPRLRFLRHPLLLTSVLVTRHFCFGLGGDVRELPVRGEGAVVSLCVCVCDVAEGPFCLVTRGGGGRKVRGGIAQLPVRRECLVVLLFLRQGWVARLCLPRFGVRLEGAAVSRADLGFVAQGLGVGLVVLGGHLVLGFGGGVGELPVGGEGFVVLGRAVGGGVAWGYFAGGREARVVVLTAEDVVFVEAGAAAGGCGGAGLLVGWGGVFVAEVGGGGWAGLGDVLAVGWSLVAFGAGVPGEGALGFLDGASDFGLLWRGEVTKVPLGEVLVSESARYWLFLFFDRVSEFKVVILVLVGLDTLLWGRG